MSNEERISNKDQLEKEKNWISKNISNCTEGKILYLKMLIPHLCAIQDEKEINKKIDIIKKFDYNIKMKEDLGELNNFLQEYRLREMNRKDIIEDKAKSSLFVITLSITVLIGILKFVGENDIINATTMLYLIIGLIYFVLSGITAVEAIVPKPFNDIYLAHKMGYVELEEHEIFIKTTKETEIKKIYKNIRLNEFVIMKKTNYTEATFRGIIVGTLFIAASFIIMIIMKYFIDILNMILLKIANIYVIQLLCYMNIFNQILLFCTFIFIYWINFIYWIILFF